MGQPNVLDRLRPIPFHQSVRTS